MGFFSKLFGSSNDNAHKVYEPMFCAADYANDVLKKECPNSRWSIVFNWGQSNTLCLTGNHVQLTKSFPLDKLNFLHKKDIDERHPDIVKFHDDLVKWFNEIQTKVTETSVRMNMLEGFELDNAPCNEFDNTHCRMMRCYVIGNAHQLSKYVESIRTEIDSNSELTDDERNHKQGYVMFYQKYLARELARVYSVFRDQATLDECTVARCYSLDTFVELNAKFLDSIVNENDYNNPLLACANAMVNKGVVVNSTLVNEVGNGYFGQPLPLWGRYG